MKKLSAFIIVFVFFLSLVPSIYRTWIWSSDAHGLVILATLDPDEMTFNPYSKNGFLINQETAIWILKSFEYPYRGCSAATEVINNCGSSLIGWVGRTLDIYGEKSNERGYELLEYFIARGEQVNDLTEGMAPIHEAILYRNARYLRVLMAAGADPEVKIERPGKPYNGFNAIQYLELLESKQKGDFSEIRKVFNESRA